MERRAFIAKVPGSLLAVESLVVVPGRLTAFLSRRITDRALKTAKALGLAIPRPLLQRADEVIE